MENIKNNRTGTDATFRVGLKDGVLIDWPSIEIKQVFMYSTEQRTFGGRTSFAIDAEDSKVLVVTWPASEQIYLGEHRLVVRIEADGVEATYDAVAINQVPFTQDVAEPVTPAPVEVNIVIDSVDTTVIREILAACQEATDRAIRASEGVEEAIARANTSAEHAEEAVGRAEHAIEVVDEQIARVEKIEENIAQALVDAEQAKQIAEQASATAEAASETAQSASTQATEAIADARQAIADAQAAKSTSDAATANANTAAASANSSASRADSAATSANAAASNATAKASEANTAAQTANAAATNANNKASDAQTAAGEARAAAARVDTAIATANTAAGNANAAATEARNTASTAAAEAKSIAETAATNANNAATEARNAAQTATESAGVLQGKLERGEVIPLLSTDLKHPTHQEESFVSRVSQGGMVDIKSIKGNSVVWNQLCKVGKQSFDGIGSSFVRDVFSTFKIVNGHKYVIRLYGDSNASTYRIIGLINSNDFSESVVVNADGYEAIFVANKSIDYACLWDRTEVGVTYNLSLEIHDLTAMGMEDVTTYEEFVARTKDLQVDKTTYNEGEVVNFTAESIKATGRNLWDEEWRVSDNRIKSVNYVHVIANEVLYFKCPVGSEIRVTFFDSMFNPSLDVTGYSYKYLKNEPYRIPRGCSYITLEVYSYGSTTYKYDICISVSDPSFDGSYEPYRKASFECDPSKVLDAESNPLFPDGLCKAGEVCDEMGETRDVKRIGKVKLKDLNWAADSGAYSAPLPTAEKTKNNCYSNTYAHSTATVMGGQADKTIRTSVIGEPYAIVKDSSYSDAATFKAHFTDDDVLYYELASPIVVDHEPRRMFYPTYKGGVESIEGENTTPIKADMGNGYDLCKIVDYLTSKAEK